MYKKKHLYIYLILVIFIFFSINFYNKSLIKKININSNSIFFTYPNGTIKFAGEDLPDLNTNFIVKEKFDKEFLNISYNLYQFFLYIKRLPLYIPFIEEKLQENNIPLDFKYLAIAESALRNDVVSRAGAAGIWQFMPETAKEYGLIVNKEIDERYNFEKSTISAIKYLNYLFKIFNNRTLTAAAYNRGQNGLLAAMNDQKIDNYYDLMLNEETGRYIYRIVAIKYVIKDYYKNQKYIDKTIGGTYNFPKTKIINVGEIKNLKKWCIDNNQNYQNIKTLNRWILKDYLPSGNWELKVLK